MTHRNLLFIIIFLQIFTRAAAVEQSTEYLRLDNITWANDADLDNDPFLVLRSKPLRVEELTQTECCRQTIAIANKDPVFDHCSPFFILDAESDCELIWWQISTDKNFSQTQCQKIQEFEEKIALSSLSNTYINPGTVYYFRVKGKHCGVWSEWSEPFSFSAIKPEGIMAAAVERISENSVELKWEKKPGEDVSYLIFGSDKLDFIPSIYIENEDAKAYNGENLIGQTDDPSIRLERPLPYYRIVAYSKGHYSVPSSIIRIHATKLHDGYFVKGYACSPYVDGELWNNLYQYLLPEYFPVKAVLDEIFSKRRVLLDSTSLRKAGFKIISKSKFSKTTVATHPKLKGYLVKMFTDKQDIPEWIRFKMRILGAQQTKAYIDSHGYGNFFKVPGKWLYPLPAEPSPPPLYKRKNFILVVEDMHVLESSLNKARWRSDAVTKELLIAVCNTLHANGLWDSALPKNIPFCKDGKIAILDTEMYNDWPIHFSNLSKSINPNLVPFWQQIYREIRPTAPTRSQCIEAF